MLANPVTLQDLVNRFRPLNELEQTNAAAWLDDAWEELHAPSRVPNLDDRLTAGVITVGLIRRVVTAMVIRVLRNPEAIREWAVDDASFKRDAAITAGALYATEDEIALLSGMPVSEAEPIAFSGSYPHVPRLYPHGLPPLFPYEPGR